MTRALAALALVGLAAAQFGGFGGGSQCDYQQLMQKAQAKDRCLMEGRKMMRDAVKEIQRLDAGCGNEEAVAVCEKCEPLAEQLRSSNDLDVQGIMECCLPDAFNAAQRQCEWTDKRRPGGHGRHGHHGGRGGGGRGGGGRGHHGGHHGGGGRGGGGRGGGGGGPPPPPPGQGPPPPGGPDDMMEEVMMAKRTLGGMALKSMGMMHHHLTEKLSWCEGEDRPVSRQAMEQVVRPWQDRLTAKLFACYQPIMDVATNCTDVDPQALACLDNGWEWSEHAEKACHMMCGEDSLDVFCKAFETAAQSSGGSAQGNGNGFFDPFKFNSRK